MHTGSWTPWRELRDAPDPATGAVLGGLGLGTVGGVIGLVLGLHAYAPTAWAAVVELGAPAGLLGAAGGGLVGLLVKARRDRA